MPAKSPAEVHELFAKYFSAGELEPLMSLYEPNATLLPLGQHAVSGLEEIRVAMTGFLESAPAMELTVKKTVQSGDIALVMSDWILSGSDADGRPFARTGRTSDVVRRQADGRWLLVIDVPHGAATANE
jgi:uncharacterized protein (TIGR02246 family)